MLGYYHDYRTMENIAFDYSVHKQRICEAISWIEQVLIKDGAFALPSKRELSKSDTNTLMVIADFTECETERPKKTKRLLKRHTIKDLIVINGETSQVICVNEAKGSVHDFEIFKQSGIVLISHILLLADKIFKVFATFINSVLRHLRNRKKAN
jgi:hypothetical protein